VAVLPALPAANTGLSTAALAAGGPRQFDRDRDLRIGNPGNSGAHDGWAGQATGPRGEGSGAVLQGPQPVGTPASRPATVASQPDNSAGSRQDSFKDAQAQLEARGVLWRRLETLPETGEWRFACSVPDKQNPNKHHTFEVVDRDYLAAIQAVIKEIDRAP
jgi:hypothetical protein